MSKLPLYATALVLFVCSTAVVALPKVFRKEPITAVQTVHFGTVSATETIDRVVSIENPSASAIRLVGSLQSCSCITPRRGILPIELGARRSVEFPIEVRFDKQGSFAKEVVFMTDSEEFPRITVTLTANVVEPHL